MGCVLAISSQTIFGPVGNSSAVPTLQEHGHDVLAIPTILLSNHPGLSRPVGRVTDAQLLKDYLDKLGDMGVLHTCDAVLTGYFADAAQVEHVAETISSMKVINPNLKLLVDPVIGDNHALYVSQVIAATIRDRLLPLATITTPNRFELSWLTATDAQDKDALVAAAKILSVEEVVITSALSDSQTISTLLITGDTTYNYTMPYQSKVPNGTGDFLAGQYLAQRLKLTAQDAFAATMVRLEQAITASAGKNTLVLARL